MRRHLARRLWWRWLPTGITVTPPTEAELVEMEARADAAGGFALYRISGSYAADVPRLIAALRAERAEVARLNEKKLELKREVSALIDQLQRRTAHEGT
jgi:hypothetical protein